ncbi:hypothetical protein [Bradyrhizobium sp. 1(2017)]|uniref:hypothetical protein n=1 Tax=Bradyrhizobium sp. 1(2017) TaxID=1404888 RepID=UPI00140F3817|nr:hypothetical protein [Bradyrhizobium sp. 1(2017)]QIO30956.1 hypothetical protein HAP40_03570 [Bradyrhizobium sp. 1(2017)]
MEYDLPQNFQRLHEAEELLRGKSLDIIRDNDLKAHLAIVELAMDLADILRQFPTDDEDLKVVQLLGMRTFNAFASSLKLALSGYMQNSALVMRDILETVFLLDLFRGEPSLIREWRFADKQQIRKKFSPVKVREALDKRYGHTAKRRAELYQLFSELAAHPTMKSALMLRPEIGGDAVIGPFVEKGALMVQLSEIGRLAVQVGEILGSFIPGWWGPASACRTSFIQAKSNWLSRFYPGSRTSKK